MTYASIMVHVDLGPTSVGRVRLAGELADRFGARLIGIAAMEPPILPIGDTEFADDDLLQEAEDRATATLAQAEKLFRNAVGLRNCLDWRDSLEDTAAFIVENARAADLVVVGRQGGEDHRDWQLGVRPGNLLMEAGRPILVVPAGRVTVGSRILVAWRNTREARRAVWDALPFLRGAKEVMLLSVGNDADREGAADVVAWLDRHGVRAEARLVESPAGNAAEEILSRVDRAAIDLVVAGGYGHSRLREWVFGGVTRELLERSPVCCLMSH